MCPATYLLDAGFGPSLRQLKRPLMSLRKSSRYSLRRRRLLALTCGPATTFLPCRPPSLTEVSYDARQCCVLLRLLLLSHFYEPLLWLVLICRHAPGTDGGCWLWSLYSCHPFYRSGMENPCLTFVTPTLLAGDRSLVSVVVRSTPLGVCHLFACELPWVRAALRCMCLGWSFCWLGRDVCGLWRANVLVFLLPS